jgi:hypothetical protein
MTLGLSGAFSDEGADEGLVVARQVELLVTTSGSTAVLVFVLAEQLAL